MITIGITGALRAGKDTIAAYLVEKFGYTRIAFADALKREVAYRMPRTVLAIFHQNSTAWHRYVGWLQTTGKSHTAESQLEWCLWVGKPPGIRELLQEYGTEVRRVDDMNYWIRAWSIQAYTISAVVVPDVRFQNEVEMIRSRGGQIWLVTRPGHEIGKPGAHASEGGHGISDVDVEFDNSGTIDDLCSRVHGIMEAQL